MKFSQQVKIAASLLCAFSSFSALNAATCCNTPTVWTFKNLDKQPVALTCSLEKSAAWTGKPISMSTASIKAGGVYKHTWDSAWYADGMGMVPGQWACKTTASGADSSDSTPLTFSTDWGENVTITWNKAKGVVARATTRR